MVGPDRDDVKRESRRSCVGYRPRARSTRGTVYAIATKELKSGAPKGHPKRLAAAQPTPWRSSLLQTTPLVPPPALPAGPWYIYLPILCPRGGGENGGQAGGGHCEHGCPRVHPASTDAGRSRGGHDRVWGLPGPLPRAVHPLRPGSGAQPPCQGGYLDHQSHHPAPRRHGSGDRHGGRHCPRPGLFGRGRRRFDRVQRQPASRLTGHPGAVRPHHPPATPGWGLPMAGWCVLSRLGQAPYPHRHGCIRPSRDADGGKAGGHRLGVLSGSRRRRSPWPSGTPRRERGRRAELYRT